MLYYDESYKIMNIMKYIWMFMIMISVLWSCSIDDLTTYDADRYIYFTKDLQTDSIVESFFFYPGATYKDVEICISYAGKKMEQNCNYLLEVDNELTTASPEDYDFDSNQTWEVGKDQDTVVIRLNKTAALDSKKVRLVLNVVTNEDFHVGPLSNVKAIFNYTSQAITPTWWDDRMAGSYLGAYSEAKYAEFIKATGISSLDGMEASDKRYYALKFKYYLIRIKNETGKPVMDGNVEMTVPVLG